MLEEYARALENESREAVESAAAVSVAVGRNEVNYLPDDEEILSEMGLVALMR